MSDGRIHIHTPHGDVRLPAEQVDSMAEALKLIVAGGGDPVWHFADCKECVIVHSYGAGAGWVIGVDGSSEWVESGICEAEEPPGSEENERT